jgi:RNA polymerase sigma-70 factor, ECF subfamily
VDERLPEQSQQATLRSLGDQKIRAIVDGFMDAMQRGDVDRVVTMLAQDAAWSMPPLASWYRGHDALAAWLAQSPLSGEWRWRRLPARANGQVAIGAYTWDAASGGYLPFALEVLTLRGTEIQEVASFITRALGGTDPDYYARFPDQPLDPARLAAFERFGLPGRLD